MRSLVRPPAVLPLVVLLVSVPACRPQPPAGLDFIRVAVPYEVSTLDPHAEDKLANFAVTMNLYEPLVAFDADMKIQPCLATSWESPDPLTWVFHLRPGVGFHSGRPLRGADVVHSINRVLQAPDLEIRDYLLAVSDVEAVDDLTVKLRTRQPSRILLNKLAHVLIVPAGTTTESLRGSADGTGAYALAGWRIGDSVRFRRNDRHWGASPEIRQVELLLGREPEDALQGLLAGSHQLILGNSKAVEAAVGRSGRHAVVHRNSLYLKYLAFDLSREITPFCRVTPNPFRDRRVRRALSAAIDRRKLVAGLSSDAVPASQPIPRFVFGFNPGIPDADYDPARARTLLKEAGLGKGFDVVLHTRRVVGEAAGLVKQALAEIGVRVDVRILPDAEFFALLGQRGASFWVNRFGCSSGDASDLLEYLVHSPDRDRQFGMLNYGGYANPGLDRDIEKSAGIEAPEDRRNALQAMLAAVMEDQVVVPLYSDEDLYAFDKSLSWTPRNDSTIRFADIAVKR